MSSPLAPCLGVAGQAGGTLTAGMTAGDVPVTGNADQRSEGYRFVGYNLCDTLILWRSELG